MKQKWKKVQAVEITIDEIFCLQDKLDMVKDEPEKVWEVFDDFLAECESQLELSPSFLKELHEADLEKDFVPLSIHEIDELFDVDNGEGHCNIAEDYINYVLSLRSKKRYEIPFSPRLNF